MGNAQAVVSEEQKESYGELCWQRTEAALVVIGLLFALDPSGVLLPRADFPRVSGIWRWKPVYLY